MSDHYYKNRLYPIQDKVLDCIGQLSTNFYLTGGTALSRFLLEHRFSDDLDFFVNRQDDFHNQVDRIADEIKNTFNEVAEPVRQDSFVRIIINQNDVALKLEFVNDVGFRVGTTSLLPSGALIDTWDIILSNKITALQRKAAKDYVDVLFLALKFEFNWETMMNYAKKKDAWVNEVNVSRFFMDFDFSTLDQVQFPSTFNTSRIKPEFFEQLARESLHGFDNSLYGKTL